MLSNPILGIIFKEMYVTMQLLPAVSSNRSLRAMETLALALLLFSDAISPGVSQPDNQHVSSSA